MTLTVFGKQFLLRRDLDVKVMNPPSILNKIRTTDSVEQRGLL